MVVKWENTLYLVLQYKAESCTTTKIHYAHHYPWKLVPERAVYIASAQSIVAIEFVFKWKRMRLCHTQNFCCIRFWPNLGPGTALSWKPFSSHLDLDTSMKTCTVWATCLVYENVAMTPCGNPRRITFNNFLLGRWSVVFVQVSSFQEGLTGSSHFLSVVSLDFLKCIALLQPKRLPLSRTT